MLSFLSLKTPKQKVFELLTSPKEPLSPSKPQRRTEQQCERTGPEWTQGLRKLYDSVVEEPLPANFKDLLDKLDKGA